MEVRPTLLATLDCERGACLWPKPTAVFDVCIDQEEQKGQMEPGEDDSVSKDALRRSENVGTCDLHVGRA